MRRYLTVPVIVVVILLLASLAGSYLLQDSGPSGARRQTAALPVTSVDEKTYLTARHLAQVADTAEEHNLAREAIRLADRELDQAFASATREAAVKRPPANAAIKDLQTRITAIRERLEADQRQVDKMAKTASADDQSAAQLDLSKAQLTLDQDELEDAAADLAQAGGDQKSALDRALEEHQTTQHAAVQMRALAGPIPGSMWGELMWWFGLNARAHDVEAANAQVLTKSNHLGREHETLQALTNPPKNPPPSAAAVSASADDDPETTSSMVGRLKRLSDQRKALTELDRRRQDLTQLGNIYQRWHDVIAARERETIHQLLRSVALLLAAVLVALVATRLARVYLASRGDSRNHHQAVTLARASIAIITAGLCVMVIFGPPAEVSTLIGFTTAGLTVALRDFIAAIFGWFSLIGKNGVHIGDWVEIEGVGGEVVDIGLFRTELLELGNWTSTGRPTGRRVSFMNTYALEHHYFNFSTTGQWLWDELTMSLPNSDHVYDDARRVLEIVDAETRVDAERAEKDWTAARARIATRDAPSMTARPTMDLRPSGGGLEVHVRYVTRAPDRYATKSRLFEVVMQQHLKALP